MFFFKIGKRAKLADSVSQQDLLLHDNTEVGRTVIPEIVVPENENMEYETSVVPDLLTEVMIPNDIKVYSILFC